MKVAHSIGKVEFVLEKMRAGKWANLGEALEDSGVVVKESALHPEWREWYVCGREQVTHDVQRLFLKPPVDNQVHRTGRKSQMVTVITSGLSHKIRIPAILILTVRE